MFKPKYYNSNEGFDLELDEYMGRRFVRDRRRALPTSLDAHITLNPHYSNPDFAGKGEVEIWGSKQTGIEYVYSDRLWQWDYNKAQQAAKKTNEAGVTLNTARWVQTYLSHYYEKPIEVCHIYSGVFPHSGYPYWAAGFRAVDTKVES